MRRHSLPVGIVAIACGLLATAAPASAALETWVSGSGSDTGSCPISAPCQTFAFAHSRTNNGGTINVLSSGNFGPVTITKSISIVADGVEAVISTVAGGAAIVVQAGANQIVSLRGLTIHSDVAGNAGISFTSGRALHVHNSVIRKASNGIKFAPASGNSELYVVDTVIADTSLAGIDVSPTGSGSTKATLDRVRTENSAGAGIWFSGEATTGSIAATVRDSTAAGNASVGIYAADSGSGSTTVMIDRSASVNNLYGIYAQGAGATIRIGDSTVSGNTNQGLVPNAGGLIPSYGTNKVNGNGTDGSPTSTIQYN